LRVAFVTGTLGQGGAEKQLVYMARALAGVGVDVRVYCLTRGEHHEATLHDVGIQPVWIGRLANPLLRLVALAHALRRFSPHILQATHGYTNLYVTLVAPLYRAVAIGAIRNDVFQEIEAYGRWARWLLRLPPGLVANSDAGRRNAIAYGVKEGRVLVVPNVIDLATLDATTWRTSPPSHPVVVGVANLVTRKRLERFLHALALARRDVNNLQGVLVGDGPDQARLCHIAAALGLVPEGIRFLGRRASLPVLRGADIMLHTSDHEGFPNVLLEAMAASLPIVTTPAGDSGIVVVDGLTGYVVPFDDIAGMAERLVRLARSASLRRALGQAGRQRVEQLYGLEGLGIALLAVYSQFAEQQRRWPVGRILEGLRSSVPGAGDSLKSRGLV